MVRYSQCHSGCILWRDECARLGCPVVHKLDLGSSVNNAVMHSDSNNLDIKNEHTKSPCSFGVYIDTYLTVFKVRDFRTTKRTWVKLSKDERFEALLFVENVLCSGKIQTNTPRAQLTNHGVRLQAAGLRSSVRILRAPQWQLLCHCAQQHSDLRSDRTL